MSHSTEQRLQVRWVETIPAPQQGPQADDVCRWLTGQYSQPRRVYHDLSHLERMFLTWESLGDSVQVDDPLALKLAIWFHDAVYDPKRHDNEQRSTEEAARLLAPLGIPGEVLAQVQRMILATAAHQPEDADVSTALLVDLDLAILGAEPDAYDTYARAIREEYGHVSEEEYRSGRTGVLRRFLERPRIYLTEAMYGRYEGQARSNLRREIAKLDAPPGAGRTSG